MVVLSRQYAEKYMLFLQFSAGGLHGWGILLVIPFEFQEIKHQPFSMTQPILLKNTLLQYVLKISKARYSM